MTRTFQSSNFRVAVVAVVVASASFKLGMVAFWKKSLHNSCYQNGIAVILKIVSQEGAADK